MNSPARSPNPPEGASTKLAANGPAIAPAMLLSIVDQGVVSGTNFLTMVIVGRACGLHELGVYSLAFSVVVILMAIQESLLITPFTVISNRLKNTDRQRSYGAATLLQQLLAAGMASTVLLLVGAGARLLSPTADYFAALAMLAIVIPFWLLKEFGRRACFVELNTLRPLVLDGVAATVQLSLLCLFWLRNELSAPYALAAAGIGQAIAAAIWWVAFRQSRGTGLAMFRRAFRLNWRLGSWSFVARLTEMLHAYSVHWLLAFAAGPAATGAFAAASSLLALSNPILMGMGNLLAPETANAYATGGISALRRVVLRATYQVTLVTAAFVVLLAFGGKALLGLAFGQAYEECAAIVVILAVGMLGGMTGFGADNGLRAMARPAENFKAALVGFVVSFLIAAVFVGRFEATGAAFGVLAGNLASAAVRIGAFLRLARYPTAVTSTLVYRAA